MPEQKALRARLDSVADSVRSLCQELHTLWEVVVLRSGHVLSGEQRQGEMVAALDLLDALVPSATPVLQKHIQMLSKQLRLALPQTLWFARRLDALQEQAYKQLGPEAMALLAWVWRRWTILGSASQELLQGVAPAW